ncbi:MAG TPA: endonuclease/exonuclease/phosphatase family protein, partial [Actinopolymorphaceae bacterium]
MLSRYPSSHRKSSILAGLAALALLVTTPAAAAPESESAAPKTDLRVMQWNVCSEYADCPELDDPIGRAKQVAAIAKQHDADVMFMLEVCESTVADILDELGDGYTVAFAPWHQNFPGWKSTRGRWCYQGPEDDINDGLQGTAIIAKGELDETTSYSIPSPWKEREWESVRNVVCAVHTDSDVRLCASHFTPNWDGGEDRPYLVRQVDRSLEIISQERRTLFAGDLNVAPPDGNPGQDWTDANDFLDELYDRFAECDERDALKEWGKARTGEGTTL